MIIGEEKLSSADENFPDGFIGPGTIFLQTTTFPLEVARLMYGGNPLRANALMGRGYDANHR